ncbi:MAG: ribonuclease M5 [Bacilli bacterium]
MKVQINALIVVEGVTDVQKLTPWIDADFITTNGSALSEETIGFIRQVKAKGKEVIVLTDPDFPGEQIRRALDQAIPGLTHVYLDKQHSISKNKVGVAQAKTEYLLQSLKHKIITKTQHQTFITMEALADLHLVGSPQASTLRQRVSSHFHLGQCNAKTMLMRLNQLGLTYDDIKSIL